MTTNRLDPWKLSESDVAKVMFVLASAGTSAYLLREGLGGLKQLVKRNLTSMIVAGRRKGR